MPSGPVQALAGFRRAKTSPPLDQLDANPPTAECTAGDAIGDRLSRSGYPGITL